LVGEIGRGVIVGCEEERGRSSICELDGWSWAEWNVAASEVAETLERERLCQFVFSGWRCFDALVGEAMVDSGLIVAYSVPRFEIKSE